MQKNLQEIKHQKYNLEFGEVFNDSLENYKKIIWVAGLVFFILTIVMVSIFMGILTSIYGASDFLSSMTEFSLLATTPSYLIVSSLFGVLISIAISPLYAGIFQICHNAQTHKAFDLGTAFIHYKTSYFKQIVISALLISLFTGIITDLITVIGFQFIGTLFTYFMYFITLFTIPFIIFGNLNAVDAIKASIAIVFKKFWIIFALMLVAFILAMIGMIAICVGIFFTLPIIYSTQYEIYRAMIGVEENDELDEIGIYNE